MSPVLAPHRRMKTPAGSRVLFGTSWLNFGGPARRSAAYVGGQTHTDRALGALDVSGYAKLATSSPPTGTRALRRLCAP
jgi:hypothetical protein